MTCKDCIRQPSCRRAYDIGEFQENAEKLCKLFMNCANIVEVVRCGKCKHTLTHTCAITGTKTLVCIYGTKPLAVLPTHFCGYGERRDS